MTKSKLISRSALHVGFAGIVFLILFFVCVPAATFSQTSREVIAVINGRSVTREEVDSLIPVRLLSPKPEVMFALRKTALENVIVHVLLENEAKRKGITIETLRRRMTEGSVVLPDGKIHQQYLENAPYFALMSPDEAKERIRLRMESEARMQLYRSALSKLRAQAKIETRLKEPPPTIVPGIATAPFKGAENAKVTIVEFSDFHCRYCRESETIVKQLLNEYKDVKFVYKHLPLQTDPFYLAPALAAYCGNSQGRFWEFHEKLFSSDDLSADSIKNIAKEIGLDSARFDTCVASEESRAAVMADLQEAMKLGIRGTPTFVINGRVYRGKQALEDFKAIIDRELSGTDQTK